MTSWENARIDAEFQSTFPRLCDERTEAPPSSLTPEHGSITDQRTHQLIVFVVMTRPRRGQKESVSKLCKRFRILLPVILEEQAPDAQDVHHEYRGRQLSSTTKIDEYSLSQFPSVQKFLVEKYLRRHEFADDAL